ncbi:hypothetical protein KEM52_000712 [Ascosphaera acerosa]|nr:hypothetical protein KEM52_000712 [Ascosphaera acerosa]
MATAAAPAPTPLKCVHKGCGKTYTDPEEECHYHPGGPEFHEGQKGWRCCKPRVLTFDEFLAIPPCTVGKHSTVDATPGPDDAKKATQDAASAEAALRANEERRNAAAETATAPVATTAAVSATATTTPPPPPKKDHTEDDDDLTLPVPAGAACRRRGCTATYTATATETTPRDVAAETCTYHPGQPIFHEGSKGWSCCKRRVLEFDQFLKIEGCKQRAGHQFVGQRRDDAEHEEEEEELLDEVRSDFYQTATTLTFSLYLKNIKKDEARVSFPDDSSMAVDLPTADGTRYRQVLPLAGAVDPAQCRWKVMKTKFEGVLAKREGGSAWPTLRRDERGTGERIQVGKARRV